VRRAAPLVAVVALAGCTSTQEKARQLAEGGAEAFTAAGLKVAKANPDVKVVDTAVLTDQNGSAAVVVMKARGKRAAAKLPVAIDVQGADGKSVFRNDAPGLEPSLTSVAAAAPGQTITWVNDQVAAAGTPAKVVARVGMPGGKAPRAVPKLTVSGVKVVDEAAGAAARGRVRNRSKVDQRELVLYGVARKGGEIVAAGRAQVRRVKPGGRASFRMYFIGDPRGADLTISVPPTSL
jgi:hypothetical protein